MCCVAAAGFLWKTPNASASLLLLGMGNKKSQPWLEQRELDRR